MKKASDYRRMARISMAGQLGTMAAAGVMKSLVLSAAVLVLVTFLAVRITGAGVAAAVGGLPVGFAEAGLILWAIFVALLILAALALSCLLNGGIVYQARKATRGEDISIRDLGYGLKAQVAWKLIVLELIAFLVNLLFKVPYWAALILQRLLATMYPAGAGLFLLQGLIVFVALCERSDRVFVSRPFCLYADGSPGVGAPSMCRGEPASDQEAQVEAVLPEFEFYGMAGCRGYVRRNRRTVDYALFPLYGLPFL